MTEAIRSAEEAGQDSVVDARRTQAAAVLDKCAGLRKKLEDLASAADEEFDDVPDDDRCLRAEALLSRWDERGLFLASSDTRK